MDTIALENIKTLINYNENFYLISDGNQLSLVEKDEYDPVNKLSSLEYPIYFTYHHLLTIVSEDSSLSYQKRMMATLAHMILIAKGAIAIGTVKCT